MPSYYKYKLLRVKADLLDDPDWVATQVEPPDHFEAKSDEPDPTNAITMEVVVEFLDAMGAVVPARTQFNVTVLCIVDRPVALGGRIVTDSIVKTNVTNSRPVLIDYLRSADLVSIRLTGIAAPAGATGMRVLYREMPQ